MTTTSGVTSSPTPDGGRDWFTLSKGLPEKPLHGLAVDPTDTNRVFVGSFDGVFRSHFDHGLKWTLPSDDLLGADVRDVVIDPSNHNTLYASTRNAGVEKSLDGGDSWTPRNAGLPPGAPINTIAVAPSHPTLLYAGTPHGVFRTSNAGKSWQQVGAMGEVTAISVDPVDRNSVLVATDGQGLFGGDGSGRWAHFDKGFPGRTHARVTAIRFDPVDPSTVYAGVFRGGMFKFTGDFGVGWVPINKGFHYLNPTDIEVDPARHDVVYAGAQYGVWKSRDGGAQWTDVNAGGALIDRVYVNQIVVIPAGHVPGRRFTLHGIKVVATEGPGVLTETLEQGVVISGLWLRRNNGLLPEGTRVRAIAVDPKDRFTMFCAGEGLGVAKTTDGGRSWRVVLGFSNVTALAISPSDPDVVYLSSSTAGVWRTADGGLHWARRSVGLPGNDVPDVIVSPADPNVAMAAVDGRGVFRTDDGGAH